MSRQGLHPPCVQRIEEQAGREGGQERRRGRVIRMKEFSLFLTRRDGWAPKDSESNRGALGHPGSHGRRKGSCQTEGGMQGDRAEAGLGGKTKALPSLLSYKLDPFFLHSRGLTL